MANMDGRGTDIRLMLQVMGGFNRNRFLFEGRMKPCRLALPKLAPCWVVMRMRANARLAQLDPVQIIFTRSVGGNSPAWPWKTGADCEFAFVDMIVMMAHHIMVAWEEEGIPRSNFPTAH